MPLYKVWNGRRNVRKIVKADSLTELLAKGKEKLAFDNTSLVRLVLNEDGTDVDDEEILEYFGNQTLLMLTNNEQWQSPTAAPSLSSEQPLDSTHSEATSANVTTPSAKSATESPPQKSSQHVAVTQQTSGINSNSKIGCSDIPHPTRIELPQFSPNVILLLQNNDDNAIEAVLREAALYYHIKYPKMKETAYYQNIGEKLVKKYPCLAGYDGNKQWSYLTTKLSSRIRQLRLKTNKKSGSSAPSQTHQDQAKKFRLSSVSVNVGKTLTKEEYQERLEEIKEEWEGTRELSKLKLLMAETRNNRPDTIKNKSVADVFKTLPVFQDGNFILQEFSAITNKGTEEIDEKTVTFFEKAAEVLHNAAKGSGDSANLVGLLEALERRVAIVQGKGTKSRTVLTKIKMDTIDVPDETLAKKLQVSSKQSFCLKVITDDQSEVVKMMYIVGEGIYINCKTTDACKAAVQLLATYYVFGRHYPAIYGQLLGFLQQQIVMEPYPFFKGTNFQTFSRRFHDVTNSRQ